MDRAVTPVHRERRWVLSPVLLSVPLDGLDSTEMEPDLRLRSVAKEGYEV